MYGTPSIPGRIAATGAALAIAACGIVGGGPPADRAPTPAAERAAPTRAAVADPDGRRIVVSIEQRRLWLIEGGDTLMSAPVGVARGTEFNYRGTTYHWRTPRGQRTVIGKKVDPVWRPPNWHYYEKADRGGLDVVNMERGEVYELSDGTHLEIRDDRVGRVNRFGNFWPWSPGKEIIFDGKIFMPPLDTEQRRVPDALGSHALDLGDGYLIHGTWRGNRDSVGTRASHGCLRMYNEDVEKLYGMVSVGTPVIIR